MSVEFTRHALQRMRERDISRYAVMVTLIWGEYVKVVKPVKLEGGKQIKRTRRYDLTAAGVQKAKEDGYDISAFVGTTVLLDVSEEKVITVYDRTKDD